MVAGLAVAGLAVAAGSGVDRERGLYESARRLSDAPGDDLAEVALAELRSYARLYPNGRFLDDVYLRMARVRETRRQYRLAAARLLQVLLVSPGSLRESVAREQLREILRRRALKPLRARYQAARERYHLPAAAAAARRLGFVQALLLIDDEKTGRLIDEELDALLGSYPHDPELAEVTAAVADFHRRHGASARAVARFDRTATLWPDSPFAAPSLLGAAAVLGRDLDAPAAALERLKAIVRDRPDAPEAATAWLRKAALERDRLGRVEIALRDYDEVISRYPEHPDAFTAYLEKSDTLRRRRRDPAAAATVLLDAVARYPRHSRAPEALLRAARIEEDDLHQAAAAAAHYEQLAARYPGFDGAANALFRAGKLHESSGDSDGARRAYGALVERYPGDKLARKAAKRAARLP